MKHKIIAGICAIFLVILCCHKESSADFKSSGKITGPDYRMCACCGGWYIQIDSTTYEFDTLPHNSGINLETESFPLLVKLDWQLTNAAYCPYGRITIQRIKKE